MKDRKITLPDSLEERENKRISLIETIDALTIVELTLERAFAAFSTLAEESGMYNRTLDDKMIISIQANHDRLYALTSLTGEQINDAETKVKELLTDLDRVYIDKKAKEDSPTTKRGSLTIADYCDSINQCLDTLAENGHEQPLRYLSVIVSDVVKDLGLDGKGVD